jgi:hypothetical protein
MDVGQNGRPRGPQMLVWFSINHPIIGVPNFDPYPNVHHQGTCPIPRDRAERADEGGVSIEPAEPAQRPT